jgi:hypothetical protein
MNPINKIKNKAEIKNGVPQKWYQVTVREVETGEILYNQKSRGGVACTMEQIFKVTGTTIEGNHQLIGWGHIFTQLYGRDRIDEFIKEKAPEIVAEMEKAGVYIDPQIKKIIFQNYEGTKRTPNQNGQPS